MDENILMKGKEFLASYLKGKTVDYEVKHPWRKNWEFVIMHSLRVEEYVKKILAGENHILSDDEVLLTRLAAILHDIGRIERREEHALIGRNIVGEWLINNPSIAEEIGDFERLLYLIERHSNKKDGDEDFCLKVLRDADVLDEIGVMSIFMASSWIDKDNPYFFNLLFDRVQDKEITFCKNGFQFLETETSKRILNDKMEFIKLFNNQLKDELSGTEIFGQAKIEDYFKLGDKK